LPPGKEPLDQPFRDFPPWFMRVTCDRCGKDRMLSETHTIQGDMPIREILNIILHRSTRLTHVENLNIRVSAMTVCYMAAGLLARHGGTGASCLRG
jgi:hypothetical protein